MKISIYTPTHNTKHLKELENSILSQTHADWEWIILTNNGATYETNDERIKIIPSTTNSNKVGALKKEAVKHCNGEIILEADHDDILTSDCLEEVHNAFQNPDIGFVYSDNAKLSNNFIPYNTAYGWTYKPYVHNQQTLYSMNSFLPTPYRLSYIWFAPDHVRAWRKSVYDLAGGYDESMSVLDDQDLIIRTYLVSKFAYIPKTLYIYRILEDGSNTWVQRNEEIQTLTKTLHDKYIYQLAERYADINNLLKIDLCGGHNKPRGYISIDKYNGDIIADLEQGIPLGDNTVGVIRAHDALEHIKNSQHLMKEIHRVLAKGGILLSMTPSTDGRGAFQDPTHVSFWNENSFWYYTRKEQARYIGGEVLFREAKLSTEFPSEWCKKHNIPYVIARLEVKK